MSSDSSSTNNNLVLTMRLSNGTRWDLTVPAATVETTTVLRVKEELLSSSQQQQEYLAGTTLPQIKLIYKGRILENERTLADYGIVPAATLFLVKSSTAAARASGATTSGTPTSTTTATTSSPRAFSTGAPSNPWGMPPPNSNMTSPRATLTGAPSNPWGMPPANSNMMGMNNMMGMPDAGMMGNNPPTPQQMQDALNNPLMQHLLDSNPDLIRNLMQQQMQTNPAVRQMMESNPAMAHLLNDPAAWDHALQMMRNPAAMQQALRGQDLALSQLENMPGGMAALQNMYSQYQQPLEDAMSGGGSATTTTSSTHSSSNTTAGASGQAMPNPWGSSSTSTQRATANTATTTDNNNNPWGSAASSSNPWGGGSNNAMMMPPGMMFPPPGPTGMPGQQPHLSAEQRQSVLSMLENPAVMQTMQQAMQQNPALFRNMLLQQNPALRGMPEHMLDQMMQQSMQPDFVRHMMQLQEQMEGVHLQQQQPGNSSRPGQQQQGLDFGSLLMQQQQPSPYGGFIMPPPNNNIFGSGGLFGNAPTIEQHPPAERFAHQLQSLYSMGFDDEQRNLQALVEAHGNLNRAVDVLLAGPSTATASDTAVAAVNDNATTDSTTTTTPASQPDNNDDDAAAAPPKDGNDKKND